MPYAHCYKALSVPNASLHVTRLTGTGHHQRPSYICLSVAMLTVTRHHQCPMPPCHCCKASSVPYASLSLLQSITSALCLPVTAARHHQCPVTAARHHQCPVTAARHHQCPVTAARHHQCPVTAARHHQCPVTAKRHHQSPVTAARHHQCPMPPYYKAHCCKASSVPYASLLQDSLLQAPLPAYLASVLCVIIAFIQRCVGLCFIPVMVWSGLCFIPRRSGLVWSGLVCVLYPTRNSQVL